MDYYHKEIDVIIVHKCAIDNKIYETMRILRYYYKTQ